MDEPEASEPPPVRHRALRRACVVERTRRLDGGPLLVLPLPVRRSPTSCSAMRGTSRAAGAWSSTVGEHVEGLYVAAVDAAARHRGMAQGSALKSVRPYSASSTPPQPSDSGRSSSNASACVTAGACWSSSCSTRHAPLLGRVGDRWPRRTLLHVLRARELLRAVPRRASGSDVGASAVSGHHLAALGTRDPPRPDAQVFFPLIGVFWVTNYSRSPRDLFALVAPFALIVGGHYLWRFSYYGWWLPNTYYDKVGDPWPEMGWRYAAAFVLELRLLTCRCRSLLSCGGGCRPATAAESDGFSRPAWRCTGGYYCYRVGGDHFEVSNLRLLRSCALLDDCGELDDAVLVRACAFRGHGTRGVRDDSLAIPMAAGFNIGEITPADMFQQATSFQRAISSASIVNGLPGMPHVAEWDAALVTQLNSHLVATRQEIHRRFWRGSVKSFDLVRGIADTATCCRP